MPVHFEGGSAIPSASLGLLLGDGSYQSAADVLRDADIAMYRAKAGGRNRRVLFEEEMRNQETERSRLKAGLRSALASGESSVRIIFAEILPNMLSLVVSSFFGNVVYAIGADVGLAFLGFEDLNKVSWGTMLYWAQNNSALLTGAWWTFVPPGLCVALAAFAMTMLVYAIDEITNPRLRSEREIAFVLKRRGLGRGARRSTPVLPYADER